jgi:hypothetical protein
MEQGSKQPVKPRALRFLVDRDSMDVAEDQQVHRHGEQVKMGDLTAGGAWFERREISLSA